MPILTVAAAQIECQAGDIAANCALHAAAIAEARDRGADLIVFPELSLTDYLRDPPVASLARTADAAELTYLAECAGPAIVSVGFIERGADGRVYNAQAILTEGRCLSVHRKANLPTYGGLKEGEHYAPGSSVAPTPLRPGWTAATLICADTWNPALPWLAAIQHAGLLIVPVASSREAVGGDFDNPGGWDLNLRHTALTYGLPIVMTNHCGQRGGLGFWGGSRIIDPFGREIARAGEGPETILAELRAEDIARARSRLPTIRDADPHLVQAELTRILSAKSLS